MNLRARSRYPQEVGPAFGYVGLPFLSSTVSIYPPLYTPSANLQESPNFFGSTTPVSWLTQVMLILE